MNGRLRLSTRSLVGVKGAALLASEMLICATVFGACGGGADAVRAVPVASLAISPSSASVVAGATRQFVVSPRDASGNVLTGRRVSWSVSGTGTASIDTAGVTDGDLARHRAE